MFNRQVPIPQQCASNPFRLSPPILCMWYRLDSDVYFQVSNSRTSTARKLLTFSHQIFHRAESQNVALASRRFSSPPFSRMFEKLVPFWVWFEVGLNTSGLFDSHFFYNWCCMRLSVCELVWTCKERVSHSWLRALAELHSVSHF